MLLFRAKVECLVYFYRPGFFYHFHKEERKTSPKNGNNEIIYVERDTSPPLLGTPAVQSEPWVEKGNYKRQDKYKAV